MRLYGRIYKEGKWWLAEVPLLDAMTQGRSRKEALAMVADLLETLANRTGFCVHVHAGQQESFEVSATDTRGLLSLSSSRVWRLDLSLPPLTAPPNHARHLTAKSVRSCLAPAFGSR